MESLEAIAKTESEQMEKVAKSLKKKSSAYKFLAYFSGSSSFLSSGIVGYGLASENYIFIIGGVLSTMVFGYGSYIMNEVAKTANETRKNIIRLGEGLEYIANKD